MALLSAVVVVVVVVILGLAGAGPARGEPKKPGLFDFDTWKSPATRQRNAAKQLEPGQLDLTPEAGASEAPRIIRLRVYADGDYRTLVLRWQTKLRAQIERINAVVQAVFGLRFEIESLRPWDRSHAGAPLDPILAELEALDPAREVDLVVGLVTPLRGVATSIHQVGTARLLSRHFVLRGMDDEQEIRALERELKLLSLDERERLYDQRKAHKEIVMFLHEWGHTLGLLHHEDAAIIMNPSYDARQAAFSPFEKRVVALVNERRLSHRTVAYPESAELEPIVASAPSDEGSDQERAELLDLVRRRARIGHARGDGSGSSNDSGAPVTREGPAVGLGAADAELFNRAIDATNAGRTEEAWALLAPLLQRLGTAPAAAQPKGETLTRLAELTAHVGALATAEGLLARLPRGDPAAQKIAGEIESTRHRVALPADGSQVGVPADREPAYVAAFWETSRLVTSADAAAARARLQQLAEAFPGAPGVDALACDLELRVKHRAVATKRCEAALAKFDGATRALTLLGLITARSGRDTVAERYLRRALLLDPTDPAPWSVLAQLYRATHASQRLAELASEHQALFSSPLPE